MEEEIKVLEDYIEWIKKEGIEACGMEKELPALENLLTRYKELEYKYNKALTDLSIEANRINEENYRCSLFAVENNDLKEKLADSIPKSKAKEKLKELDKQEKEELKGMKGQDRYFVKQMYNYKRQGIEELLGEE